MGNSKSKRKSHENTAIKVAMKTSSQDEDRSYHTVLFGTGQSGKSTIFRQLRAICKQHIYDREDNKDVIRQNIAQMVKVTLRELMNSNTQNDKNCDINFLDLLQDDARKEIVSLIQSSSDRTNIYLEIHSLVNDLQAIKKRKPLPSGKNHTKPEIMQKLTDIIQNRMPKLKHVMKLQLSNIFDLTQLFDCLSVLLMLNTENFYRFSDENKITMNEWDNTLDNTTIDMNTATISQIEDYNNSIHKLITRKCTDRCINNMESYGKALYKVWNELKPFRYVYYNLGVKYKVNYTDNIDYFFNKCLQVFHADYIPNNEDSMRMYIRTTGNVSGQFNMNEGLLNVIDTGGQRNERKKWEFISFSNGCHGIIYVVGLDHFRQRLFEDESVNGMQEALDCFEYVLRHKIWERFKIILILNKKDLFKQSLKLGHKLSICFGNEYKGMNYNKTNDLRIINNLMINSLQYNKHVQIPMEIINMVYSFVGNLELSLKYAYEEGIEFIKQKFLSMNKDNDRKVEIFVLNAIEQDDVQKVIKQIWDVVCRNEMK